MERPPGAGPDTPASARVYEYLTGGYDYFPADAALAGHLTDPERGYPGLRQLAGENRGFVLGAARWAAAMLGAGQFIDAGCGLPSVPMVHDAARDAVPAARVAYVDRDPVVVRRLRAVQDEAGWQGTAVAQADACDPAAVLADEEVRGVIDLGAPACVVLGTTLSAMGPEAARDAVRGFAGALAPGSAVIISCISYLDDGLAARMTAMFGAAGTWRNHQERDVASFFGAGGLRLVHGRVMDVACWPACPVPPAARAAAVLGGIGIRDLTAPLRRAQAQVTSTRVPPGQNVHQPSRSPPAAMVLTVTW